MKRMFASLLLLVTLLVTSVQPSFASSPVGDTPPADNPQQAAGKQDFRHDPKTDQQLSLKKIALDAKLEGKTSGKTHQVARGQYVELAREGESTIWTVLGEFSDFSHNSIAEPDRNVNNTTIWTKDFSRGYIYDMLFSGKPGANSMRNYYIEQSSGRYTVNGDVTDWITAPNGYAYYDDNPDSRVWLFLQDVVNGWYDSQIAAGKTDDQINAYLAKFDVWDRYDYDGDGNFDEPDGYIDRFQAVHAGEGEEAGGGALGGQAIWSHSWYAFYNLEGIAGPEFNKLGGVHIGNSNFWVGKYTIQPENGGVGVFTHEFAHDLGLPDLYDTAGGENGTGFWTLMSSGSWMGNGTNDIGSMSSHMGAWEKFQLGWLKYEVARAGVKSEHKVGPMEFNTKQAQGVFVVLPKKQVVNEIATPIAGSNFYYSGAGDDLDNSMFKAFNLPAGAKLTAKVNFQIELDWDYAYVVVSTDNGATWNSVPTNFSTADNPNGQNFGNGITGASGGWVDLTADLSGYTGDVLVGFRYWTDGAATEPGFMADEIVVAGSAPAGAEVNDGWTLQGFRVTNGTETSLYNQYYVVENRTYLGYDSTLKVGPYNFGFLNNPLLGDFVEHYPYQDGLLINYWDTSQADNNTSVHPGSGLVLPIDAHPQALKRSDGVVWRNRVQTYDATFTVDRTDALKLHINSVESKIPSLPAVKVFDDTKSYYDAANKRGSVIVPVTGTQIRIQSVSTRDNFIQIEVSPVK